MTFTNSTIKNDKPKKKKCVSRKSYSPWDERNRVMETSQLYKRFF